MAVSAAAHVCSLRQRHKGVPMGKASRLNKKNWFPSSDKEQQLLGLKLKITKNGQRKYLICKQNVKHLIMY